MRLLPLAAAVVVLAGVTAGAAAVVDPDAAVEALVVRAESLPPEFSADLLLRIASLPTVGVARRRVLADEAAVRAHGAPDPQPLFAPAFIPIDGRQGATARAARAGLDRVSLGVRAALTMSSMDPDRGRELFEHVRFEHEAVPCAEALVANAEIYYAAAADIARRRYPPGSRDAAEALPLFGYYLWQARLATELPAVARAIIRFRPSRDEMLFLDGIFRVVLERGAADPRGLSAAGAATVRRIGDLADREHELWIATGPLLASTRKYLEGQFSHGRCGDDEPAGAVADAFNDMVARHAGEDDRVAPIPAGRASSARVRARARVDRYWTDAEAAALLRRVVVLAGPERRPFGVAERAAREWQERAVALLNDLERWQADGRDRYWQKQQLAGRVAALAPTVELQARALRIMIDGRRHAAPTSDWRSVWFLPATGMIDLAHGRPPLVDLLVGSGEPVLEAYARLDRLTDRGRD